MGQGKLKMIRFFLLVFVSLTFMISSCDEKDNNPSEQYVVMLSLDGFRWDYPDIYSTPNLDSIARWGVKMKALRPSFPSKTFPNHYSIATGLNPDKHGLVNNTYVDPVRKDTFSLGNREKVEDSYYYGGEPIWVTAEKQGVKSASFYWVGSEAAHQGIYPSIWKSFDSSVPFENRLDSVISWLKLPADSRPHLITWYFEEPDKVGHDYGPVSPETKKTVEYLDSLVGVFVKKIKTLPYADKINLIFISDHGMGEISKKRYINVLDVVDTSLLDYYIGYNPVVFLQPRTGLTDSVDNRLDEIKHISSWTRDEIPQKLAYGSSDRISDIIVVADSGWSVGLSGNNLKETGGAHGYDNFNKDMGAIFYAFGPAFKTNYIHPETQNTEIYNLLAYILDIKPSENEGDIQRVKGLLKE